MTAHFGEEKSFLVVNHREVESLVNREYDVLDYCVANVEGCESMFALPIDVSSRRRLERHEQTTLVNIQEEEPAPGTTEIALQDLVNAGVIEPGHYLVTFS